MKIIIPTYKRLHNQVTLDNLGELRDITYLVVRPEEYQQAKKVHHLVIEITEPVHNIAQTLEWIVKNPVRGELFWRLDDDMRFYRMDKEGDTLKRRPLLPTETRAMYDSVINYARDYAHGGLWTPVAPPKIDTYPAHPNSRYFMNAWYDLSRIDVDSIDWSSIPNAEDFHVMLQLYEAGLPWLLVMEYFVVGKATNEAGGCSSYRTIELHNQSMRQLQAAHPKYVSLTEKVQKTGPWKDQTKLAARISVKQPRREINTNSFSNLFETP